MVKIRKITDIVLYVIAGFLLLAFLLGIINALSIVHREYVVSYHLVEGNQKLKFWLPSGNYEFGISNDALNSKTDDSEKPYQSKLHIEVRGNEDRILCQTNNTSIVAFNVPGWTSIQSIFVNIDVEYSGDELLVFTAKLKK
jgi:hypothetical protein